MKTIVFLGTNKSGSSREAIRAAERMGYYTVLLTNRHAMLNQPEQFPEVHRMILDNLRDLPRLRQKLRRLQNEQGLRISAIYSCLDSHVHTAALLSQEFCGTPVSVEAIQRMEDKILTRQSLQGTPYSPYYAVHQPDDSLDDMSCVQADTLPLVVKSPSSAGSKDVLLAQTDEQLRTHTRKLLDKYPEQPVLFEEFLKGPQFLVEVLVEDGNVHLVAVILQEITDTSPYLVMGYAVLPTIGRQFLAKLSQAVEDIIEALGMWRGACHLELRLVRGAWKLIEINPRISGGAMNQMIKAAYGIDLTEQTLRLWLGESVSMSRLHSNDVFTRFLTVEKSGVLKKVTGRNKAWRMPGVVDVFIKPIKGQYVTTPSSMGHRYAYVMATGRSVEEARSQATAAAAEIQFHLRM
ncbi:ATP-grasp domain-containing protein [Tumebacillus permanentifrigoris]|uniref:Biotin carboxylase n=1 Tax=Tumebacillus permanentifrigoris TaxID=378543 RepID=A0A316DBI8_9BACL|nr:ATP-grasp domain-containing protein [Tumebacillus permanentifrigoris]PWK11516.1 biotin carboxylase [Tumebacillus permanentifrigoris]